MLLKLSPFGGLVPRTGARLLPDNAAQVASNVKLQSGELRPLREPLLVSAPTKTRPALSLYRARYLENAAWFTWPMDADVVRIPLTLEAESRFAWTGDGIPKIATYTDAVSGGNNDYPKIEYALGVPAPVAAPTVTPSGGVGAATTRIYQYTYFSILGEESAPSPASNLITGKVDDTWAITAMDALPVNSGNITALTHTGAGKSVTITTAAVHMNRVGEQVTIAGVTTVTNVNGTWTLTAVSLTGKTMTFTVTSTPAGTYNNATDTTDTWTRTVSFNIASMKRYLYRSTGLTGTIQLVADDVGTTYNDVLNDSQILGDELISAGWIQPPVGLTGLKVHSSGALVGFTGSILCFSEPYQAHAWPLTYQRSTDRDIVGISAIGSDVAVGTKGNPWIASGVEPATMTFDKVEGMYPCLSKRSVIGFRDGLIYASAHGLVLATRDGVSIFTEPWYTKDEWAELAPSTMMCATAYGRLYLSYLAGGNRVIQIFDGDLLVTADVETYSLYTDESAGELYISDSDGIKSWDNANGYPLQGAWRSKDFVLLMPVNLGAAKIEFDLAIDPATQQAILDAIDAAETANAAFLVSALGIHGGYNARQYNQEQYNGSDLLSVPETPPSNQVTFILRKNEDELVVSRVASDNKAFRLPAGYKEQVFSVEVLTQCVVKEIRVAETMYGLRDA